MSQRRDLEDAVVTALSVLKLPALGGAAGGYLKTVEPYQGSLDPDVSDPEMVELLAGGTPAIGVTTDSAAFGAYRLRQQAAEKELSLELLIVSSNLRSRAAGARGDDLATDPGAYQILQDARAKLFGVELGVDGVGFLQPTSETAVVRGQTAIWRQIYTVRTDVVQPALDANDADYDGIITRVNDADSTDEDNNPITEADITF